MKIGDSVEVLDETISGKLVAFTETEITLETEEGFQLSYKPHEVIVVENEELPIDNSSIDSALKEKSIHQKNKSFRIKPKERNAPAMEVDLHIHNLTGSTRNMTNFEMLNLQLDTAKRQLDFAIKKRIQKVVFVHGVGQGVLRAELETLFNRYDNVKFYDADYQKYGLGATEVYIFQNP